MKRIFIAALAASTLFGALATANAQPRWDSHNNNGYYTGNTWHYGTPPSSVQRRTDFRPGFQNWRRGQRLPADYRHRYQVVDYHARHLPPPRRGYHYVQDDTGNVLLVAVATGLIASIIANH